MLLLLWTSQVGFHAFRLMYNNDKSCYESEHKEFCGSLWMGGHSGLGVEMHSFFDPDEKFFNGNFKPTYMNFCNIKTNSGGDHMYDMYLDDLGMDDW